MYLTYCICRAIANPRLPFPAGVDGQPVSVIMASELCMVVSAISNWVNDARPDVERILAFEHVVETFHRERAVLPVRYGWVLDGESQAIGMLNQNKNVCLSALRELEGCVELGIRIIAENQESEPAPVETALDLPASSLGVRYLAARKSHYIARDRSPRQATDLTEATREAFRGLFVKCRIETAPAPNSIFRAPVMSLDFLVERKNVNAFRQTFRKLNKDSHAKFLLSGPWPPYSFVPMRMEGEADDDNHTATR
ncbi:MAG: GvpL/GvpF family gas vesicle protein [Candidatus Sumerlaeota bacterium]|nr:GvpL/GvpF family gas vesicle protein [Candidatus Sumerlaeota bacterium]